MGEVRLGFGGLAADDAAKGRLRSRENDRASWWGRRALRDCGIRAFAIVGIAMEIGIDPTARHGADLGYIPVVIKDACGYGHHDAAERSIASLEFAGDSLLTTVEAFCAQLGAKLPTAK